MTPRAKLESGKASDSVGGLRTQVVREGGRDRTVHPGGLRDRKEGQSICERSFLSCALCSWKLRSLYYYLCPIGAHFDSQEVLSGKGKAYQGLQLVKWLWCSLGERHVSTVCFRTFSVYLVYFSFQ